MPIPGALPIEVADTMGTAPAKFALAATVTAGSTCISGTTAALVGPFAALAPPETKKTRSHVN